MNIFFKFTTGVFFKASFYLTSEKLLSQVFWLLVLKYFKVSFHSCRLECLEHTSESGQEASGTQISLLPGACDDSHWRGLNRGTEYHILSCCQAQQIWQWRGDSKGHVPTRNYLNLTTWNDLEKLGNPYVRCTWRWFSNNRYNFCLRLYSMSKIWNMAFLEKVTFSPGDTC